ncbi:VOC family protein [Streptomyces ossamyceticus]|jgi:predicted enzyme related to lactoylglutathione lyase|uniref:VOC family protein n=1 Tax=Streptomyces ossamyceticus TaxID=249581 RepID=UPI0006E12AC7|nr:VOC family protein [Streptomyces ossamyceticus]
MDTNRAHGPDIKLSQCFLAVDDHDKALAFYRDVLGMEVRGDVGFEGMRWVTVGSPLQPDVEIVLEPPGADPDISPADREAIAQLLAKGVLRGVNFTTDDCDALYSRVEASGADVLQEPMDQPYGVRDCAFRDPAGNMLRFMEPRKSGEAGTASKYGAQ